MKKFLFGKKTLSVLCTLTLTLSVCMAAIPTAYAETAPASGGIEAWDGETSTAPTKGNGSESDPYIIETAAELYYVVFKAGEETKNKYYQLENDIYLNDTSKPDWESSSPKVWENNKDDYPNNDNSFRGNFDGNGYVVHGIYTDITGKGGWYKAALFPKVEAGDSNISIKNVGVEDSAISGNQATAAIVGQIAGSDSATITVSGCYADESVKVNGTGNVGGLVGLVEFIGTFKLENCFSRVHLNYSGTKQKADDIGLGYGSLVGWFVFDVASSKRQLTNCYAVVFNEDFTEGFNTVPVGSWGDEPIMQHVTYSGTSGSNEDNTAKVQRGAHQAYCVPQRWVTDFKGTSAQGVLTTFDFENIWAYGADDDYISLRVFNKPIWNGKLSIAPSKGKGLDVDPYIIETPAELYYVVFEAGEGTKDKYYKLANDIYLNDTSKADWESNSPNVWESTTSPNNDTNFLGHFDGNGYVVHGIYTDITGKEGWYKAALFPRIWVTDTDVEIKNVGVEDSSINGNYVTAAIVGQVTGNDEATDKTVTVSGCYADESVKVNGKDSVGGLVAQVAFKGNFKLENCFSRVHLDYSGTKVKSEDIGLGYGSLVGWFVNDVDSSKRQFTNCYAVVFNEDFTEGFNIVPVGSWGDKPIMEHVTYSGTSGSNEDDDDNTKVQRGEHQQYWVPQRRVSDFKGGKTLAELRFDSEIWLRGTADRYPIQKVFVTFEKGDVNRDEYIDILDLVRLKKISSGGEGYNTDYADLNNDKAFNATDLTLLKQMLLGA